MEIFGMGAGEILLVLLVILIVFGPTKLPELSRSLGKMIYQFKKASSELTDAVTKEVKEIEETKKEITAPSQNPTPPSPVTQVSEQPQDKTEWTVNEH